MKWFVWMCAGIRMAWNRISLIYSAKVCAHATSKLLHSLFNSLPLSLFFSYPLVRNVVSGATNETNNFLLISRNFPLLPSSVVLNASSAVDRLSILCRSNFWSHCTDYNGLWLVCCCCTIFLFVLYSSNLLGCFLCTSSEEPESGDFGTIWNSGLWCGVQRQSHSPAVLSMGRFLGFVRFQTLFFRFRKSWLCQYLWSPSQWFSCTQSKRNSILNAMPPIWSSEEFL